MKITIPTKTKSQADYVLSHMAKNTGVMGIDHSYTCDDVVTLKRNQDNTITASSNYFTSAWDIADRLPGKWCKWIKENY
jgi:hypothetical protein